MRDTFHLSKQKQAFPIGYSTTFRCRLLSETSDISLYSGSSFLSFHLHISLLKLLFWTVLCTWNWWIYQRQHGLLSAVPLALPQQAGLHAPWLRLTTSFPSRALPFPVESSATCAKPAVPRSGTKIPFRLVLYLIPRGFRFLLYNIFFSCSKLCGHLEGLYFLVKRGSLSP